MYIKEKTEEKKKTTAHCVLVNERPSNNTTATPPSVLSYLVRCWLGSTPATTAASEVAQ